MHDSEDDTSSTTSGSDGVVPLPVTKTMQAMNIISSCCGLGHFSTQNWYFCCLFVFLFVCLFVCNLYIGKLFFILYFSVESFRVCQKNYFS